ncbi:MAG TPA: hypothetical protein VES02_18860, partial [Dermatophilaceae bacterium]|nr:hypothetical protein [Dermatophilaceae bacterium]
SQNGARSMVTGELLNGSHNVSSGQNAVWFGGGLTAMAASNSTINTVDDLTFATSPYLATGLTSTGNKSTPTLKADLLGDWREELVLRASGNRLAIVTTLSPTEYGIRTLMHDPMYRLGVANKNTGYDQFGFASFYLGDEAELPSMRTDISVPAAPDRTAPTITVKPESKGRDGVYSNVSFTLFDAREVDKLTLNGIEKDLTDNTYSDAKGVKPGVFGTVLGANKLRVYDVAGNVTTVTFTLVEPKPAVPAWDRKKAYNIGDQVS